MKKLFSFSFLLIFFCLQAQDSKIFGKVVDEYGLPLETVTVIVEGTTKGVVTDQNGVYSISASPSDVLVFSYLGFKTQKISGICRKKQSFSSIDNFIM